MCRPRSLSHPVSCFWGSRVVLSWSMSIICRTPCVVGDPDSTSARRELDAFFGDFLCSDGTGFAAVVGPCRQAASAADIGCVKAAVADAKNSRITHGMLVSSALVLMMTGPGLAALLQRAGAQEDVLAP